jgi:hypothetical protein
MVDIKPPRVTRWCRAFCFRRPAMINLLRENRCAPGEPRPLFSRATTVRSYQRTS